MEDNGGSVTASLPRISEITCATDQQLTCELGSKHRLVLEVTSHFWNTYMQIVMFKLLHVACSAMSIKIIPPIFVRVRLKPPSHTRAFPWSTNCSVSHVRRRVFRYLGHCDEKYQHQIVAMNMLCFQILHSGRIRYGMLLHCIRKKRWVW